MLAGIVIFVIGTLLPPSHISFQAQGSESSSITNISAGEEEEEENNKAITVAFTEAFNHRNHTAIEQYVAENITEHRPGVMSGRNSTIDFLKSLSDAFPDFQTTVDHMVTEGDRVVVFTTTNGTHQGEFIFAPGVSPSGKQITFKTADLYRISNGQLVEHWDVIEILDMLSAIGAITFSQPPAVHPSDGDTANSISNHAHVTAQ